GFNGLSIAGLEAFIKEQELMVMFDAETEREGPGLRGEVGSCGCPRNNLPGASIQDSGKDCARNVDFLVVVDETCFRCGPDFHGEPSGSLSLTRQV
ncbi:unnamed protein product, partial [Coregonus sp. 'balchen']